jgi:xylulose-5-phosphate/fructose-6-phosphate phosphoketolase
VNAVTSAPAPAHTLAPDELRKIDAYWRAANYLSIGQIYLLDNPLLREPLTVEHIKPRLLGHWGTTPGLNFIYAHINRIIKARDLAILSVTGPGHGGPGIVANTYLEGTYGEYFPDITSDVEGMRKLFRQFSFPGGIPSHVAPQTPGSINEGGELGYSLSHAYGAAFDNPNLTVVCTIGDGEAETGPLATSWHSNKFLNPISDGAVLPILHLNGFKIANPTILARIGDEELEQLLRGYGHTPYFVSGDDPATMHELMAKTLDRIFDEIARIQKHARENNDPTRPRWPMIVLRTPKGWTGPKFVDGKRTEGSWRAHQVPLDGVRKNPEHLAQLESWMKSYKAEELFDESGRLIEELRALAPQGAKRLGDTPYANGGRILQELELPNWHNYAIDVAERGRTVGEATKILGEFLRDIMHANDARKNFRVVGPDETSSNRLDALFETTGRRWEAEARSDDGDFLSTDGRVMEILSEHTCQGWLEGYLLTGRHGLFNCYEAFIHIVDSMFNQHAKWLEQANDVPWRTKIASLNYLLSSHVWRQDHNGFSHQDPGFIDVVLNKKASVVRVYLPPDANTLLSTADHCLRSRQYVNVIVAGKQPALQYLSAEEAGAHCAKGVGIWDWASNDDAGEPDLVMASAGDIPTLEALAATAILRDAFPGLKVRFINVVDLMKLQPDTEHPHGLPSRDFDVLFTPDKPVVFAFHGYPAVVHRLVYNRTNTENFHVHGFIENGTTTTPFDMVVLNELDRYHLVLAAIERTPALGVRAARLRDHMYDELAKHHAYVREHGEDMPEVANWSWPG